VLGFFLTSRRGRILTWVACVSGVLAGVFLVVLGGGNPLPTIPAPSQGTATIPAPRALHNGFAMPYAKPIWIKIPAIGVSAPVTSVGLNPDGTLQVPPLTDRNLAAWYDKGVAPGQKGPAVVVGHVDSDLGPSVFFKLHTLRPGDTIEITRQYGPSLVFTVSRLQQVPKSGFPTRAVYGPVAYPNLRLITCGGKFDHGHGSYEDNVIVFAILTGRV
jgi:hypothetical protein